MARNCCRHSRLRAGGRRGPSLECSCSRRCRRDSRGLRRGRYRLEFHFRPGYSRPGGPIHAPLCAAGAQAGEQLLTALSPRRGSGISPLPRVSHRHTPLLSALQMFPPTLSVTTVFVITAVVLDAFQIAPPARFCSTNEWSSV